MFHELERSLDRGRMTIHASPTPNNERYWKDNENNDQTVRQQYKDDFEENNFDTFVSLETKRLNKTSQSPVLNDTPLPVWDPRHSEDLFELLDKPDCLGETIGQIVRDE